MLIVCNRDKLKAIEIGVILVKKRLYLQAFMYLSH